MGTLELLEVARLSVAEVTGNPVEGISGFRRDPDHGYIVTVEVLELQRVPSTMDLLAEYEVNLTDDGDMLGLTRRRRYHRASVDGDR